MAAMGINNLKYGLVGLFALTAIFAQAGVPKSENKTLKCGEETREYLVRIPTGYTGKAKVPLVMLLHGYTGTANVVQLYTGFAQLAEQENFLLVCPQGLGKPFGWNCDFLNLGKPGVDDVAFLTKVLDEVEKDYAVDKRRIYVAGHSNGAMMANVMGSKLSNRIAAIGADAGVIGIGPEGQEKTIPKPAKPLSVIHIHGRADAMVGFERPARAVLKGVGAVDGAKWWAKSMGLPTEPTVTKNGAVERTTYKGKGVEVTLIALDGWSHDWPIGAKSPINASREMWDFFKRFRK